MEDSSSNLIAGTAYLARSPTESPRRRDDVSTKRSLQAHGHCRLSAFARVVVNGCRGT